MTDKTVVNISLNVEGLQIGKNSLLVARCDEELSPEISDMLQNELRGRLDDNGFKGVQVFVLDKGLDLNVAERMGDAERLARFGMREILYDNGCINRLEPESKYDEYNEICLPGGVDNWRCTALGWYLRRYGKDMINEA